jgi:hypothetical protein
MASVPSTLTARPTALLADSKTATLTAASQITDYCSYSLIATQSSIGPTSSNSSSVQNMIFGVLATTFAFIGLILAYKQLTHLRESRDLDTDIETSPLAVETISSEQDIQTDSLREEYEMDELS